ncbi:Adenylosuccinate synthetase 2 [Bienertia sinuspersici]
MEYTLNLRCMCLKICNYTAEFGEMKLKCLGEIRKVGSGGSDAGWQGRGFSDRDHSSGPRGPSFSKGNACMMMGNCS